MRKDHDHVLNNIAKLTVQEGKEGEFKDAATEFVAAVKVGEAGRTLVYTLGQNQKAPTEFFFIECYTDLAALDEHRKTPHMAAFGARIGGLLGARTEIIHLDVVARVD